jgi:hypothetical protein
MKEKKRPRTIQIPEWMDAAVSELAIQDKRSVSGEIEFLVEAAMRAYDGQGRASGPVRAAVDAVGGKG